MYEYYFILYNIASFEDKKAAPVRGIGTNRDDKFTECCFITGYQRDSLFLIAYYCTASRLAVMFLITNSVPTISNAPIIRQAIAFCTNPATMKVTKLTAATVMA